MRHLSILLLALLLVVPGVVAREASIPLLAVSEGGGNLEGSLATLTLELQDGKGRVFLETHPVTRVDTQISMRFAQQVACKLAALDCSQYDFIYTLRAQSGIVGGPSAGAAATALTYGVLTRQDVSDRVGVTGTINSGGVVGAVGGLREKIEAGLDFDLVLIPAGTRVLNIDNATVDLVLLGQEYGVSVEEVAYIEDVIYHVVGEDIRSDGDFIVDSAYDEIMASVAQDLCSRSASFNQNGTYYNETQRALELGDYYSAASFCFRDSVAGQQERFANLTEREIETRSVLIREGIDRLEEATTHGDEQTLTELQSSIIVRDRLRNARDALDRVEEEGSDTLAFATERLHSATAWSSFYALPSDRTVRVSDLRGACRNKIQEALERYQYVQFYIPNSLGSVYEMIVEAQDYAKASEWDLCLFTAAQAKAEANVVVSVIGADADDLENILDRKLEAVEKVIAQGQEQGFFPIIGYSYYQYADSLRDVELQSALLFSEYAIELSGIDLYFPQNGRRVLSDRASVMIGVYLFGLVSGILFALISYLVLARVDS